MRAVVVFLMTVMLTSASALNVGPSLTADKYFAAVVRTTSRELITNEQLPLTPSYVAFTLTFNLAAHIMATREATMALQLPPLMLISQGLDSNLYGVAWGALGALAVAAIEVWRCGGCSIEEENAAECPRCSALRSPVLVGTAPLAVLSNVMLRDPGVGERAATMVASRSFDGAPRGLPSSTMLAALGGALVSCAWAQGIVQPLVCAGFREATMRVTLSGTDADMLAAHAGSCAVPLPNNFAFVSARMVFEPIASVLVTALLVAISDNVLTMALQPVGRARADAIRAALQQAKQRSRRVFGLEAPAEEAELASAAFEEQVGQWLSYREESTRMDLVASAARGLVAASVFAASGGCLLAPVLASLGVVANPEELPLLTPKWGQPSVTWAVGFTLFALLWACGAAAVDVLHLVP